MERDLEIVFLAGPASSELSRGINIYPMLSSLNFSFFRSPDSQSAVLRRRFSPRDSSCLVPFSISIWKQFER